MAVPASWLPYCGAAPVPAEIMARWNFDPWLVAALALATIAYWIRSRGFAARRLRFGIAFFLLLVLFISPLCALSSALFSARVVHHVLLGSVVAPLLVAAFPEKMRAPGSLAAWTGAQALVFWSWHSPPAYSWALSNDAAYWLMQASLLGTSIGFWAALRRSPMPSAVAALLATTVQMGLLGALLTFAGAPLFAPHYLGTAAWGLSPLQDQQAAGLIMWAPAAGFYLAAALMVAGRWIGRDPRPAAAR